MRGKLLKYLKFCVISLSLSNALMAHAELKEASGVESLSSAVRLLLSKEMISIQNGIIALIPAYAAGDTQEIAVIAKHIKDSYILKQSLSLEQKHELENRLPSDFFQLDERFHYYAGMLEHAAQNNKLELIGFYFSKLTESCSACHADHAKHRFPAFEKNKAPDVHSH